MSHFTVLVIGENIEDQLDKYDENREVAPRIDSSGDDWQTCMKKAQEFYKERGRESFLTNPIETVLHDWTGHDWKANKEGGYDAWTTRNPDARWDWYVVGGRWDEGLTTKDGRTVNTCTAAELDLDNTHSTFALVKDGEWIEKGRMGWFASVKDPMPQEDWDAKFRAVIEALPADTAVTLIDAHI